MKQEIEAVLHPLIGEPLSDMMRYGGCQKFEFGKQLPKKNRKGVDITVGEWGLVVSCDWRITGTDGVFICYDDFGPGWERRDEKGPPFYDLLHENPPRVEAIQVGDTGGLLFRLSGGFMLEVIPARESDPVRWAVYEKLRSEMLRDWELWRFMPKKLWEEDEPRHFVVTTRGVDVPTDRRVIALYDGIVENDLATVRWLLDQGVPLEDALFEEYDSALQYAAIECTTDMVRLLLKHGAGDGAKPSLIDAARGDQIETVRLFLGMGGDVNQEDEIGWTPLMEASSWGTFETVRFLVENGADVMKRSQQGHTALQEARKNECTEVAEYLIAHSTE